MKVINYAKTTDPRILAWVSDALADKAEIEPAYAGRDFGDGEAVAEAGDLFVSYDDQLGYLLRLIDDEWLLVWKNDGGATFEPKRLAP